MKKFNYLYLAGIACLASCSSDEFIGEQGYLNQNSEKEISFASNTPNVTRATGSEAATKLGYQFNVYGVKALNSGYTQVFNNYGLWFVDGSKSESNQKGWEYVTATDITPAAANNELGTAIARQDVKAGQTIKFWDYSASDYWFYAISAANETTGTAKENYTWYDSESTPVPASNASTTKISKCVIENVGEDNSVYYADAVHHTKTADKFNYADNIVPNQTYNGTDNEIVTFTFKRLQSKVRIGFYETVPGYAINEVKFHTNTSVPATPAYSQLSAADDGLAVNLISTGNPSASPATGFQPTSATYIVKYHGTSGVASLELDGATFTKDKTFGQLNYLVERDLDATAGNEYYMGESASAPTWAVKGTAHSATVTAASPYTGSDLGNYWYVLPNESQSASFKIKVDYTLTSLDGSHETIHVKGAEATVPAQYCNWNGNTAYTYLFKISDNTNGTTGDPTTDPKGLYPITFDACVEDVITGNQETITTVATPSITTYAEGSDVVGKNEYTVSQTIVLNAEQLDGATVKAWHWYEYGANAISEQEAALAATATPAWTWNTISESAGTYSFNPSSSAGKYVIVRLTYTKESVDKHAYKVIRIVAGS